MQTTAISMRRLVLAVLLSLFVADRAWAISEEEWFAIYRKAKALKAEAKSREALRYYEEALRTIPEVFGANHENTGIILNQIGNTYIDMGEYAKAEQVHRRVLAFRESMFGRDSSEVGESLNNLGIVYMEMGEYVKAEQVYQRSLGIYERVSGKDSTDVADLYDNLGNVYWRRSELEKARAMHSRGLAIREARLGKNDIKVAQSLNALGLIYADGGEDAKAEPLLRRSLAISEATLGKEHPLTSDYLNNLGYVAWHQLHYAQAEAFFLRSLQIREKVLGKDHPVIGASVGNLAQLYLDMGQYAKVEPLQRRSLAIYEAKLGKDHPRVASGLNNLALMYRALGEFARAEPLLRRSLAIKEAKFGKDNPAVADALNNLGLLLKDMGQHAKAIPLFERSLQISEAKLGKNHPSVAQTLNNLGVVYLEQREYAKAEPLFQRSLELREAQLGKNNVAVAMNLNNLANLYRLSGNLDKAETLNRRALEIKETQLGKDHPDVAASLNNLANVYGDRGEYARTEPLLRRSLEIREAKLGKDHPEVANAYANLGMTMAAEKKWDEAADLFQRERRCVRRHVARVLPSLSPAEQSNFLLATDQSSFHIALMLGWERRGEKPGKTDLNELSAGWVLNGKAVADEALAARALLERDDADPQRRPIVVELRSLRQERAGLALAVPKPGEEKARQQHLETLERRQLDLEKQLAQLGGLAEPRGDPWVDIAEVRKSLPADSVYIDIIRFRPYNFTAKAGDIYWRDERFAAWVVPPAGKGAVRIIDLGEAKKIDDAVSAVRAEFRAAQDPDRSKNPVALDEGAAEKVMRGKLGALARLALHPLLAEIGNAKEWVISPDASLWLVPWAALTLPDGSYAVEKYTLRYVISGRDLVQSPVRVAAKQPLIFADPDYDLNAAGCRAVVEELIENRAADSERKFFTTSSQLPRVARLPGTAAEAKAVQPLLQVYAGGEPWTYRGKYAQEAVFKSSKNPKVLLLSTHGYFLEDQVVAPADKTAGTEATAARTKQGNALENPLLRCGLLLAGCNDRGPRLASDEDGVLTGLEIVSSDLRGTELVVLSACETGLGDVRNGQGVAGLRQAFQLAGAQTVLATLWQVPDRDSALLMIDFFTNLGKQKKAEALRSAQLARIKARRERGGNAHPYFWAAFTITGQ